MSSAAAVKVLENACTVQCRVLHALILLMSVFVLGFQLIGQGAPSGIPAALFFIAGISPFFMFREIFSEVVQGTRGQQSLLMFPQVTRMDLLVAKVIVNSLVSISVFLLLVIGLYFLVGLYF